MTPLRGPVVVAVDFSETSERALDVARGIARRLGAELLLVHAFEVPAPLFNPYAVPAPGNFVAEAREAAQRKLEAIRERLAGEGLSVRTQLAAVPAATALAEIAQEIGAGLVVTGTHGHTGLKHVLLGSVAERTVREAPCPVLTVKDRLAEALRSPEEGADMEPIRTIVAAVDFSELSDQALEAAIDLAKQFGAELHLVHAFDVRVPLVTPYEVAIPTSFIEEARRAAKRKLDAHEERAKEAGLTVHAHLTEVPAATSIAEVAEEAGADLIVMGTHGHTGLKHVVLGSVAERTLRHAPCSVLTVKRRGE